MSHIEKKVLVNAPVGEVFAYLNDPNHLLEIWPNLVEVANVQRTPDGAHSFDFVYKMAGIRFKGHTDTVEVQRDDHMLTKNSGIPSTFRWTYAPRDGGTEVSLAVDYQIPGKVFSRLAAPIVSRLNERDAEILLSKLKARFEERARPVA